MLPERSPSHSFLFVSAAEAGLLSKVKAMGLASYHEDILLRAAENGFDSGSVRPVPSPLPQGEIAEKDGGVPPKRRRKTIVIPAGEGAGLKFLHLIGVAKQVAYLQVVVNKTGQLVQEFPFRQRSEVEAKLAEIEVKYPGVLRLVIAKRLEVPEDK